MDLSHGLKISKQIFLDRQRRGLTWGLTAINRFVKGKEDRIGTALGEFPEHWHIEDKILCWLMPEFTKLTKNYYFADGPLLREIVSPQKFRQIDEDLLIALKLRLPPERYVISDSELINEFSRVMAFLGREPTFAELGQQGKYAPRLYHKRFGGYRNFLKIIQGSPDLNRGHQAKAGKVCAVEQQTQDAQPKTELKICINRLFNAFSEAKTRVGRTPNPFDLNVWDADEFDRALTHFGSWKEFVRKTSCAPQL